MLTLFARTVTGLNRFIGRALAWGVIPLFLLLLADVVMRYVAGRPLVWTAELGQLMFGVYAVLGGGWLLAERGHVNVDIIYGALPARRKAMLDIGASALFFLFLAVLLWQGWSLALDSVERMETSHSVWNPPIWPVKLCIPLAALLLLLQGIVRLIADIRLVMGLENDPDIWGAPPAEDERQAAAKGELQE